MSMIFNLLRVSEEELNKYLDDSSLLTAKITNAATDNNLLDIDKSWEGILFILTGQNLEGLDHPLGAALFSGQLLNAEQDLGYGPAHYLIASQVQTINEQLAVVSAEEVKKRYNPARMTELSIYPRVWDRQDDEVFDYLLEYFEEVKIFYAKAVEDGQAVITFLS